MMYCRYALRNECLFFCCFFLLLCQKSCKRKLSPRKHPKKRKNTRSKCRKKDQKICLTTEMKKTRRNQEEQRNKYACLHTCMSGVYTPVVRYVGIWSRASQTGNLQDLHFPVTVCTKCEAQ